ncbi:hypothetical protein JTE90_015362 [Oedothorax gibbosus]|uniref:Prokineticin domain-containing protein n=1 Tax=Oedothorax gibbosus TaxID=931172 RepID=A0AAV6U571_9ARAC|nr:hypothetical protein JTE90_015362 [Oedothorax gibbosus]
MLGKTILKVLLVAIFVNFVACRIATKRCTKQSDCDVPRECCSTRFLTKEAYCVPRRSLGEVCLDGSEAEAMINNTYSITCPCEVELTCIKEIWYSENGNVLYQRNPRCREAGYEPPPMEYYMEQNAINNGYYGNNLGNGRPYAYSQYNGQAKAGPYALQYRRK